MLPSFAIKYQQFANREVHIIPIKPEEIAIWEKHKQINYLICRGSSIVDLFSANSQY
jgi:hypothetical protein